MSQKIAPGAWEPGKRQDAKLVSRIVGGVLMTVGMLIGLTLTRDIIAAETDPAMWLVVLVSALALVPFIIGCIAVFPSITPLVYRVLDEIDGRRQGADDA